MTTTASKTQDLLERQRRVLAPSVSNMLYYGDAPLAIDRAKDQYVWDVDGARYLDFFGGILTVSIGHCNDEVVAASKLVPDDIVQMITASGTPDEVRAKVDEYVAAGCTCPILYPLGPDVHLMIDTFAK